MEVDRAKRAREEAERKLVNVNEEWQHKLADCEQHLATIREELDRQRSLVTKTQAEGERTAAQLSKNHADELDRKAAEVAKILAQRDVELDQAKRAGEEFEHQKLDADEAWQQRFDG